MSVYNFIFQDLPYLIPYIFKYIIKDHPVDFFHPIGFLAANLIKPELLFEEIKFVVKMLQINFNLDWGKKHFLRKIKCDKCNHLIYDKGPGRYYLTCIDPSLNPPHDLSYYGAKKPYYVTNICDENCWLCHYIIYPGIIYCTDTTTLERQLHLLRSFEIFTLYDIEFIRYRIIDTIAFLQTNLAHTELSYFDFPECDFLIQNLSMLIISKVNQPKSLYSLCCLKCIYVYKVYVKQKQLDLLHLPLTLCKLLYNMYKKQYVILHENITHNNCLILNKDFVKFITCGLHSESIYFTGPHPIRYEPYI